MRTLTAVVAAIVLLGAGSVTQERRPQDMALQAAIRTETVDGDLGKAIKQFSEIADRYKTDRATAATALVHMAGCYQKRGDPQATKIYEQVLRDFGDQKEAVAIARAKMGRNGQAPGSSPMTYRRVWSGPKVDTTGGVSADGRYLTYIDWNAGDLMLRDLSDGTDRRLTGNGTWPQSNEYAEQSAVSRDGRHVAYAWFDGKQRYQLRVTEIATAPNARPRTVLDQKDVVWIAPYDWSPDGKWIVVVLTRPDRSTELGLIGAQDGALRKLRSLDWRGPTRAFFSPDGKYVAFDLAIGQRGNEERDVFVLAVEGGRETAVAANQGLDRAMAWSPDGTRLLFSSERTGTRALWSQGFTNGTPFGVPELVKPDIGHAPLGLTGAGTLYVGHQVGGRNVYIAEVDFSSGRLLKAPERAVDRYVGNNEWPDWSRDGKFLSHVYARNWVGRDPSISIRSVDTGEVREIPLNVTNGRNPLWAPDGSSFVSQGVDSEGRSGIYRIDAGNGAVTPIAHSVPPNEFFAHPEFAPDGRKVYYLRFSGEERAIIEHDLRSGSERVVIRRAGISSVYVSPDGRSIATVERTRGASAALVVPVAGGEPREVLRVSHPQVFTGPASWSPDGLQLMINTFWVGSDRRETWLVPIAGGTRHTLDLPGYSWGRIRVHPDGRRIAYHAGELKYEVWVLENFLTTPTSANR